jgi:two-component system chemotaxis sensor kinase CheA
VAGTRSRSPRGSKKDREFVSEAEEILERMRDDLADVADRQTAGGEVDPDGVNRLFRSAHSLKALAGLFGFDPVRHLAHQLEDILDALRLGRVAFDPGSLGLIDDAVGVFASLLECVGDPAALESMGEAIDQLLARIGTASPQPASLPDPLADLDLDESLLRALTEYEEHRLRENLRRGRHIFVVEANLPILSFEEGLSQLGDGLRAVGEVLSTLPAPGAAPDSEIRFSILGASERPLEEIAAVLDTPGATLSPVVRATAGAAPRPLEAVEADQTPAGEAEEPAQTSLRSISETVRVDVGKLDDLMNLVGELVVERGAFDDLIAALRSNASSARLAEDFAKAHKSLNRKLKDLQSAVLEVRMVPLRQVFDKVSRVVRGLRRNLDRDVRLEMRGADTELDKVIAEELVDPLMHVVRNALDHGIESPDVRRAAGKDAQGRIDIEAFQRGNHVVIEVSDDGAGIDVDRLCTRARELEIVPPDAELGSREAFDLIFAPGISTRSQVTDTSGRGVGMDVVRTNLSRLGGAVDVRSERGQGTTLSMTLPITLAIIQSLLIVVGRHRFAVPLNSVLETLIIDRGEIQRSQDRELLDLRGDALPLRRLAEELGISDAPLEEKPYVVVVGVGDHRIGLLVDRLDGQQDTVIKSIQGPVRAIRGIAGATEVGDRNPVLVIDVAAFVGDAERGREAA